MLQSSCKQDDHISAILETSSLESLVPNVPEWHKNANVYEVHIRQYTSEGSFKAFQEQ